MTGPYPLRADPSGCGLLPYDVCTYRGIMQRLTCPAVEHKELQDGKADTKNQECQHSPTGWLPTVTS